MDQQPTPQSSVAPTKKSGISNSQANLIAGIFGGIAIFLFLYIFFKK